MTTCRRAFLAVGLLLVAAGHGTTSGSAPNAIQVSLEFIVNPVDGSPRSDCEVAGSAEAVKKEWWVSFGRAAPQPEAVWQAKGGAVTCGQGAVDAAASDPQEPAAVPYLTGSIVTSAVLLPSSLTPERVLFLDISLSGRKLSAFGKGGAPEYRSFEVTRRLFFTERRDVFVPVLVADGAELRAFGIREILMKVGAWPAGDAVPAEYGAVSVTSTIDGATILLDGGAVGKTSSSRETLLRNVRVGLREVRVRDASGREAWKAVRVAANRTVLVELSPPAQGWDTTAYRLVALGKNAQGFDEYRRSGDGAVVVRVPAGGFLMGNKNAERTPLEHRVYVSEFLMDKTGVTFRQFKKFLEATGAALPPHEPYWGIHDDHPAVFVTWEEAKAYCEWAGGRLPTEAEREKAARGVDDRKYPWGNEEPDASRGVFRHNWGDEATEPVGTHPAGASPYGLQDMGGNVWEYCADWYDDAYYSVSPPRDPKGPATGTTRVVRGGSWDSRPSVLSCSCRNWADRDYREGDFGFRCAMNAPK